MKKLLLISAVLGALLLTGCMAMEGIVLLPVMFVAGVSNSIKAEVGECIDANSDTRPRTIFSLEIPKGEPFEKICVDGEYKHVKSDCRFAVLYRRNGELLWPTEFYIVTEKIGGEFTGAFRYVPKYENHPVNPGGACLLSPEAGDELLIIAGDPETSELRFFSLPFSALDDYKGDYEKGSIYSTRFFSDFFGKRFPHKVIKVPQWNKLTPLDGESKKYYQAKFFPKRVIQPNEYPVEEIE
ncbi:MAG: hypothetical protein E7054_06380 [Lentisphaerae bacterium]|nr:hypothetical protein [Lentisphaerota bacterium]